jgi:ubiquitin-conjugating enzyme E2 Q
MFTFFFQYEIIHNPLTVDLLVSLAYNSASEGAMDDPLPVGLGLRVPTPITPEFTAQPPLNLYFANNAAVSTPTVPNMTNIAADGLCEFDELDLNQVRIYSYLSVQDYLIHLLDEALHRQPH